MAKNNEEPKKGKASDSKQSPMYKVAAERKIAAQKKEAELKSKEYISDKSKSLSKDNVPSELQMMKESIPASNKTIEYFHKRYQ